MAKLTKSQLMTVLAEETGMTKADVKMFMEKLTDLIYREVKGNGEITLPGLAKFQKKHRAARMGRNPATGEQIHIAAKTVCKARVLKALKDAVL